MTRPRKGQTEETLNGRLQHGCLGRQQDGGQVGKLADAEPHNLAGARYEPAGRQPTCSSSLYPPREDQRYGIRVKGTVHPFRLHWPFASTGQRC